MVRRNIVPQPLVVLAMIYTFGDVSGAHLNPAVTLAFAAAGRSHWREVPGYLLAQTAGAFAAGALLDRLAEEHTRELVERLRERGLKMEDEGPGAGGPGKEGPLAGKTFVITGTLPRRSREACQAAIEAAGGKVTGSVSKKTNYLLLGADPGSKLAKAEQLGTEILDEGAFLALLDG